MSELAFNIHGERFDLPEQATALLVKHLKGKGGPPPVVYAHDGTPLHMPVDATLDDLKAMVTASGRYRLDPVDENGRTIPNAQSAYVQVNLETPAASAVAGASDKPTDNVVIEAIRSQSAMALAVIERFPQMMDSAANLLRAADGAGLPAREPRADGDHTNDGDDDADDGNDQNARPAAHAGFDLNAIVAQIVPIIIMSLTSGKKLPGLGELLDWRKAAPKGASVSRPSQAATAPVADTARTASVAVPPATTTGVIDALPPIDPQTMMHFIAIQSVLDPKEAALAREVAGELAPAELRAWFDELSSLSVPDAVLKIRALIGAGKPLTNGAVS